MSKNFKVALLAAIILSIIAIGFFYQDHEDSKMALSSQPVLIQKTSPKQDNVASTSASDSDANINKEADNTLDDVSDTKSTKTATSSKDSAGKQKPIKK